ncbi:MAG: type II toxin-antitoxin system Phd/YefM family antitoxin [Gemmatimonadales bacterium]|nr:type II toxin-antitoxin system Phd/YefM family antitoxin [Gemmatimonadales bacterium]
MTKTIETMSISEFKATCLAVLERVRKSGRPLLITRRGQPIAEITPPSPGAAGEEWVGTMRGSARITGDLVAPVVSADEWEALNG